MRIHTEYMRSAIAGLRRGQQKWWQVPQQAFPMRPASAREPRAFTLRYPSLRTLRLARTAGPLSSTGRNARSRTHAVGLPSPSSSLMLVRGVQDVPKMNKTRAFLSQISFHFLSSSFRVPPPPAPRRSSYRGCCRQASDTCSVHQHLLAAHSG